MALTKQVKYKDSSGNEQLIDIGVDAKNVESNTFTQATARANLASGDKLPTIFGKLMKWFADLKTVAWTGSYNDLTNKPTMGGITGTVAVTQGGTGATTASQARVNLGVGAAGTYSVANNCTTTAAGYALDARQGKALMDKANQINSDLGQCKLSYDGTNFYIHNGLVKKKLDYNAFFQVNSISEATDQSQNYYSVSANGTYFGVKKITVSNIWSAYSGYKYAFSIGKVIEDGNNPRTVVVDCSDVDWGNIGIASWNVLSHGYSKHMSAYFDVEYFT